MVNTADGSDNWFNKLDELNDSSIAKKSGLEGLFCILSRNPDTKFESKKQQDITSWFLDVCYCVSIVEKWNNDFNIAWNGWKF